MESRATRPEPDEAALRPLLQALVREDDGEAARSHLAAGRAIYCGTPETPAGHVVKEYPDGRRELVRFDHLGQHRVRDAA